MQPAPNRSTWPARISQAPPSSQGAQLKPYLPVDRRPGLTKRQFEEEYLAPRLPVVIPDGARLVWRGAEPLTLEWLGREYGHLGLDQLKSGFADDINLSPKMIREWGTLGRFLDAMRDPELDAHRTLEGGAILPYLANVHVARSFAGMLEKLAPEVDYLGANLMALHPIPALRLFAHWDAYIGPKATTFGGLHADPLRTWLVTYQAVGKKSWFLYPPGQASKLYLQPDDNGWCHQTPFHLKPNAKFDPDPTHYPLLSEAQGYEMCLQTGDVAFMPPTWFHCTLHHEPSLAVSYRHLPRGQLASHTGDLLVSLVTMGAVTAHRTMVERRREPHR